MSEQLTELERAVAEDIVRIAKRFKAKPNITVVVRPQQGTGERDLVMSTDDFEEAIAAIRRLTGRTVAANALSSALSSPAEPLRPATTVDEARQEAMGLCLGVIDMANTLTPPATCTGRQALDLYSAMVEKMCASAFGERWSAFVKYVRSSDLKKVN